MLFLKTRVLSTNVYSASLPISLCVEWSPLKRWLISLTLLFVTGCAIAVPEIAHFHDTPDKKHRVYVRIFGERGKSILEKNIKNVEVEITALDATERTLLKHRYRVVCANPSWEAGTFCDGRITVEVYQLDRNMLSKADVENSILNRTGRTVLKTISYNIDPKTGKVTELASINRADRSTTNKASAR